MAGQQMPVQFSQQQQQQLHPQHHIPQHLSQIRQSPKDKLQLILHVRCVLPALPPFTPPTACPRPQADRPYPRVFPGTAQSPHLPRCAPEPTTAGTATATAPAPAQCVALLPHSLSAHRTQTAPIPRHSHPFGTAMSRTRHRSPLRPPRHLRRSRPVQCPPLLSRPRPLSRSPRTR